MKYPILVKKLIKTDFLTTDEVYSNKGKLYTFLNPVSYLDALRNKKLFADFNGIFADGGLLVKAIKILYGTSVERRSFDMTSMAPLLFEYASSHHQNVAIVATKQEPLEKAIQTLRQKYPKLNISYYRNGYFADEKEMEDEARKLAEMNPDFLIVGMGIIIQERFLLKVKQAGFQGIGFTCGGFIHQTAENKADYYPQWINDYGLRFLYRMYKEPHTRKRYAKAAFVFPIKFIWEKFTAK